MSFIILSKQKPFLYSYTLPPDSKCLVFDSTPEGYRRACQWIQQHRPTPQTPLCRLVIPCTQDGKVGDLCDYELLPEPRPHFCGRVDAWPPDTVFAVAPILLDVEGGEATPRVNPSPNMRWPAPSENRFSDLYGCGYCSERALTHPDPFTGLTRIQLYVMDEAGSPPTDSQGEEEEEEGDSSAPPVSVNELCQRASLHFNVPEAVVMDQMCALARGNEPWIRVKPALPSRAGVLVIARKDFRHPLLPPHLLNGPFPMSRRFVYEGFRDMIVEGKVNVPWHADAPTCAPYAFTRISGAWYSYASIIPSTGIITLPYGMNLSEAIRILKPHPVFDVIEESWQYLSVPDRADRAQVLPLQTLITPSLTFCSPASPHELITYASVADYAYAWKELKLDDLMKQTADNRFKNQCLEKEQSVLRTILVNAMDEHDNGNPFRVLLDENIYQKRARLEALHGEEYTRHLLHLPLYKMGPEFLEWEDKIPMDSERDRWASKLRDVAEEYC